MTPEIRTAIAQDVLDQLALDEAGYIANRMCYVSSCGDPGELTGDLRDHLGLLQANGCEVCAVGGMFLSIARLYNHIPAKSALQLDTIDGEVVVSPDTTVMMGQLAKYFDPAQLELIECAFEGWSSGGLFCLVANVGPRDKASNFNSGIYEPEVRMRRIMENIVDNNGEFIP